MFGGIKNVILFTNVSLLPPPPSLPIRNRVGSGKTPWTTKIFFIKPEKYEPLA